MQFKPDAMVVVSLAFGDHTHGGLPGAAYSQTPYTRVKPLRSCAAVNPAARAICKRGRSPL